MIAPPNLKAGCYFSKYSASMDDVEVVSQSEDRINNRKISNRYQYNDAAMHAAYMISIYYEYQCLGKTNELREILNPLIISMFAEMKFLFDSVPSPDPEVYITEESSNDSSKSVSSGVSEPVTEASTSRKRKGDEITPPVSPPKKVAQDLNKDPDHDLDRAIQEAGIPKCLLSKSFNAYLRKVARILSYLENQRRVGYVYKFKWFAIILAATNLRDDKLENVLSAGSKN